MASGALARAEGAAAMGRFAEASEWAARAVVDLERRGDGDRAIDARLVELEALEAMGRFGDVAERIEGLLVAAQASGDGRHRAAYQAALGRLRLAEGDDEGALAALEEALGLARASGDERLEAALGLQLAGAQARVGKLDEALALHRRIQPLALEAGATDVAARSAANAARAALELGDAEGAGSLIARARELIASAPRDHTRAFVLLHLARTTIQLAETRPARREALIPLAHALLVEAEAVAFEIGDRRAEAWAHGYLARLYEAQGRAAEALELTERALLAGQVGAAVGERARWNAQAGRLLARLGRRDAAIAAYREAIDELQGDRHALAVGYGDGRGSFREREGAVYLEAVDLLLQRAAAADEGEEQQADLRRALETIELLKAAELRDYYRDECVDLAASRAVDVQEISALAAVIYPIALRDRVEVLVSTRAGTTRTSVDVPAPTVLEQVAKLEKLLRRRSTRQYLGPSRKLHEWIIAPIEAQLSEAGIATLVFVPDAVFRGIPPAALHDGERFLIERYALASTPGLQLTAPGAVGPDQLRVLRVGLSESVQGYDALPSVPAELAAIGSLYPGDALLDAGFVESALQSKLETGPYNAVHIASHAEFTGDPRNAFVLTHQGRLTIEQIARSARQLERRAQPLELITFSACETAEGDDEAVLGLSGLAVRAGARSALGTLWKVNDLVASRLMTAFYTELGKADVSRAEALRRAQRAMIAEPAFAHPDNWAPFILIGNWL